MKNSSLYFLFLTVFIVSCYQMENGIKPLMGRDNIHSKPPANIDDDFDVFINYFSKDSLFQVSRVIFPIKIKVYNLDLDTMVPKTIIKDEYRKMDFTIRIVSRPTDKWKQEIKMSINKAKIEIRGLENGIMMDVFFEKRNGKWMLITWDDRST